MNVTKDNASMIYAEAQHAAATATQAYIDEHGEHPFNCGFAWVTIKPARGAFVNFLKKADIGHKGTYGGWMIWNPSDNFTQDMSAKAEGAGAFASVLYKYGINHTVESRLD